MTSKIVTPNKSSLILLGCGLTTGNTTMLLVMLPLITQQTGLGLDQLGMAIAAGPLLFAVSGPFWSNRSDKIGRRSPLRVAAVGLILSQTTWLVLMWPDCAAWIGQQLCFGLLLLSRILYGLTVSAMVPVSQAWLADHSNLKKRTASMMHLSAAMAAGRLAGPLLVLLSLPGHVLLALAIPLLLGITFLFKLRDLPEGPLQTTVVKQGESGGIKVWPFCLLAFWVTLFFGMLQYILGPVLQQIMGVSATRSSTIMSGLLIASALVMLFVQKLAASRQWHPLAGSMSRAALLLVASSTIMATTKDKYLFCAAVLLAAGAVAVLSPAYTAAMSMLGRSGQGRISAQLNLSHSLGHAGGALSGGLILQHQPSQIFFAVLTIGLLATLTAKWLELRSIPPLTGLVPAEGQQA